MVPSPKRVGLRSDLDEGLGQGGWKTQWNLQRRRGICKSGGRRLGPVKATPAFPLVAQQALQKFNLLAELVVIAHELLDLADRVQHGGVVAVAKPPANLGKRA